MTNYFRDLRDPTYFYLKVFLREFLSIFGTEISILDYSLLLNYFLLDSQLFQAVISEQGARIHLNLFQQNFLYKDFMIWSRKCPYLSVSICNKPVKCNIFKAEYLNFYLFDFFFPALSIFRPILLYSLVKTTNF